MRATQLKYLAFLTLFIILIGCSRKTDTGFSQGRIEFDLTYLQDQVGGYSAKMMPRHMRMEYREDLIMNRIEGGFGFFNLVNISDLSNYRNITYLKFIDIKYIYMGKRKETPCCFGNLEGMELEFTEQTREIAGFLCKHAFASFPDNGITSFDIWYTEEIPLDSPNGNSPFRDIPGVMLEFITLLGDVPMHVQARRFEAGNIHEREFQPPDNYTLVSKTDMEKIIDALLE